MFYLFWIMKNTIINHRERVNEDFIYSLSADETSPALAAPRHTSTALFSCRFKCLALPGGKLIFTTTPTERITHYTLLRKVVCQMGALSPLEPPPQKRRYATPPRGTYRLFLLSSPPALSVEQKSAWD